MLKRGSILILVVVFLLFAHEYSFAKEDVPNCSGYIVTNKGVTINFTKVQGGGERSFDSRVLRFKYGPEDKMTKVPLAKIKEITFIDGAKSALILLRDGRKIDARSLLVDGKYPSWRTNRTDIYFFYFDEIQNKERLRSLYWREISRIVIGDFVGRFRQCPLDKTNWPESYLFCPYDGTQTVWGEIGHAVPSR